MIKLKFFLFFSICTLCAFGQNINRSKKKTYFPSDLPTPRFIINLPDSVNGISIVYDDIKSITAEKLTKLKDIELVELCFSNQQELDKEIGLLVNFPKIKYLNLKDAKFWSKITEDEIILPETLLAYKNIVSLSFNGEWKINYKESLKTLIKLPKLSNISFENIIQVIPNQLRNFKMLTGISISNSRSVHFPEWISELTNLESVSISLSNYGSKGPAFLNYASALKELEKLPKLKNLSLSYLNNVDEDIEKIKFDNLENLSFYYPNIKNEKSFVKFITNHYKLKTLSLNSTKIKNLTSDFKNLKILSELTITGYNDTLNIDFDLKSLKKLEILDLSYLKLSLNQTDFPKYLTRLNLTSTSLKTAPLALTKVKQLKTLNLSYNLLIDLPDNFGNLTKLENLDLSSNKLKTLNPYIGNCSALKSLKLNANPLSALPASLCKLKELTILEGQYCDLTSLPDKISDLKKLATLNLTDNFIMQLPNSFSELSALKTLNLSFNNLVKLPEKVGNLWQLENLQLSFNKIKTIPISIGEISSLKKINLGFNDLDSIPNQLSNLKNLEEIYLYSDKKNENRLRYSSREIYRPDNPKPSRQASLNHIKNFPENLSNWNKVKILNLNNNEGINALQLFKGLFSISSKNYSLELENCGITEFPADGWKNFLAKGLFLKNNQVTKIPDDIVNAPYLTEISLNDNRLPIKPINLNQYVENKYEKSLWFVDLGIFNADSLPKTDSMVLALINKASNHYYRKEFRQSVDLTNRAININKNLAIEKSYLTNLGEASYMVGDYKNAIEYLSIAIKKDTAEGIRIMNFVIPDFEFRAKSYLKLGDTLSAIKDYETLSKKFSNNWGEVGLLYRSIGKNKEALTAFDNGIKKYQDQIDFYLKSKQEAELTQLSLLELLIIKEDFDNAEKYALTLEKEFKATPYITLLKYLKACATIGNNLFDDKNRAELDNYIRTNKKSISRWGYELFFKWLRITKISKQKANLIRALTDSIKP